jgi:hypothetical protein
MPASLSFTEPSLFVIHGSGHLTYDDCIAVLEEILAHPKLSDRARILGDGRAITKLPSAEELRSVAHALRRLSDRGVHSLGILTASTFVYGVARMFSVFAQVASIDVPVFKDMDEAQRWLSEAPPELS